MTKQSTLCFGKKEAGLLRRSANRVAIFQTARNDGDVMASSASRSGRLRDPPTVEMAENFKFRQRPHPSDIFDATFLPPVAMRRIDETTIR